MQYRIDVQGAEPVKQRYYRVSPKVREDIYKEVDDLLAQGKLEESNSPWFSPIVMIRRANGTYRLCIDFRKVNQLIKRDAYPLPYMDMFLDKLCSAQFISTIDLKNAFLHIPLTDDSKEITAFTVPGCGLYQ